MTREERLQRRQDNKVKRKERKAIRRSKFDELITRVRNVQDFPDDGSTPVYETDFIIYWPVIRAALDFVESSKITRPKMDLQIQRIIQLGDGMAENPAYDPNSEFILIVQKTWRIIRSILIAISVFLTKEKTDERIDKLIEIGDWITGLDGND
jgi:hypothetical protein